jgi:uncharacterized membrane protein
MSDAARTISTERGGAAAFVVYVLYLLSIPSFAVFALTGVIVAYVTRSDSAGLARAHIEEQIRVWWVAFSWGVGLVVLGLIGWLLTPLLIGFPVLWLAWALGLLVMLWFTVKNVFGLIALLEGRAPSTGFF